MDVRSMLRRLFKKKKTFIIDLSKEDVSIRRMWVVRAQQNLIHKGKMGGLRYQA